MITIAGLLLLAAFILTIAAGAGRAPLWPAVLLLVIVEFLHVWPR